MGYYISIFVLISTIVLLSPTSSLGETLALPLAELSKITELEILGTITCPITSVPPYTGGSEGVAGVPITAICTGINDIAPQFVATTDAHGHFSLPVTGLDGHALVLKPDQPISCDVTINFPVAETSCHTFPPTGILKAPVIFGSVVDHIVGSLLGGLLAKCNLGLFHYTA